MSNREQLLDRLFQDLDSVTTGAIRFLAARTSRRSFLGKFGMFLAGMGTLPMLPVIREAHGQASENITELGNPESCDYWRYCAFRWVVVQLLWRHCNSVSSGCRDCDRCLGRYLSQSRRWSRLPDLL